VTYEINAMTAPAEGTAKPATSSSVGSSRRAIIIRILAAAILLAAAATIYMWMTQWRYTVTTDDAYAAADMSALSAKVSGLVVELPVANNTSVKEGQLLAKIDDGDYILAVTSAQARVATQDSTITRIIAQTDGQRAAIEQANAQLQSVEATVKYTETDLSRAQKLAASDFASQSRLDQAKADNSRAVAAVEAARSAVIAAQRQEIVLKGQRVEAERARAESLAALDQAKRNLAFTEIRAPFNGVVGNRAAQLGQYVQPGARLMSLVPLEQVRIEANLKETQLERIHPGLDAKVAVDALGGRVFMGKVESIGPASGSLFSLLPAENATGNFTKIVQRFTIRIALPEDVRKQGLVRPGMSVVVSIDTREPH